MNNKYDVTEWKIGNAYEDIGGVLNSIIEDIKNNQAGGTGQKPGAVIYIPPGDYILKTQVLIDVSYLKLVGSGHGFTSSSIRFNTSPDELEKWHELWPGGSRVLVDLDERTLKNPTIHAAFYVEREGAPRISSVEFENFCIDGLHFEGNEDPENTYKNGKTGIYIASANDSFRINAMCMVYLEHGLVACNSDAMSIHDNFIAECGNCIEMRGMGQASKITDNLIGAGYNGYSIYAENHGGLLVAANNVFPRGMSSVCFSGVARSAITGNRFHSFYPGVIVLQDESSDNTISANHVTRDKEPWQPMLEYNNGVDEEFGLINISGSRNSVMANHICEMLPQPETARPVIIRLEAGRHNYISNNYIDVMAVESEESEVRGDSCFEVQVGALLGRKEKKPLDAISVFIDSQSKQNTILDSGTVEQVAMNHKENAFRATPSCT